MPYISWSIVREDILLLRALHDVSHEVGFYIDVGANSPQEDSVTKLFYDHGWRGINIEPSPHWYARLANERPRDVNLHAAASDVSGRLTLYDHPEGGLGTTIEQYADRHVTDWNIPKRLVEVEAVTLAEVCARYASEAIHFLKIDVEGHEEQALKGMDFQRYRPWILCIEATEPMRNHILTHDSWDHIVVGAGYSFALFDGLNRWYVADEHPERLAALAFPTDDYVHWTQVRHVQHLENRVAELEARLQLLSADATA